MEEQRPSRPRAGLGQVLRRQHPKRETGIDEPAGKLVSSTHAPLDHLAEADLLGERHTLIEGVERTAAVQVRSVHVVAGSTQLGGEGEEPRRLTLRMVEQQHLSHLTPWPSMCGAAE